MSEPFVLPVPAPGERVVGFGDSGSGKTVLLRSIFAALPNGIAIDTKVDGELNGLGEVVHGEKIYSVAGGRYVWRPNASYLVDEGERERFWGWVLKAGNRAIYMDEIGDTCESAQSYPTALRMAITRGRSRGLTVISGTQEPVRAPTFMYGQAAYTYVFMCSYPTHQKLASQMYGVPIDFSLIPWKSYKFMLKTPAGRFGPLGPLRANERPAAPSPRPGV